MESHAAPCSLCSRPAGGQREPPEGKSSWPRLLTVAAYPQNQFGGGRVIGTNPPPPDTYKDQLQTLTLDGTRLEAKFTPPGEPLQQLLITIKGPPFDGIQLGTEYPLALERRWEGAAERSRVLPQSGATFQVNSDFATISSSPPASGTLGLDQALDIPGGKTPKDSWTGSIVFKRLPRSDEDYVALELFWRPKNKQDADYPFIDATAKWRYSRVAEQFVIALVPSIPGRDDAERNLLKALDQAPQIGSDNIYGVLTPDDLLQTARRVTNKASRQLQVLVICGHGSRDTPGLKLGGAGIEGELTWDDVDLDFQRSDLERAQSLLAHPESPAANLNSPSKQQLFASWWVA